MPTTPRRALRYPALADTADVPRDLGNLATDLDDVAIDVPQGTLANRPAPASAGRYYWATDVARLYRDTGAAWAVVAPGASDLAPLPTTVQNGAAGAPGVSPDYARADHVHPASGPATGGPGVTSPFTLVSQQFRCERDADGVVRLYGRARRPSGTTGTTMTTLSANFRPRQDIYWHTIGRMQGSSNAALPVLIIVLAATGTVDVYDANTRASVSGTGNSMEVSLDGLTYLAGNPYA